MHVDCSLSHLHVCNNKPHTFASVISIPNQRDSYTGGDKKKFCEMMHVVFKKGEWHGLHYFLPHCECADTPCAHNKTHNIIIGEVQDVNSIPLSHGKTSV